MSLEELILNCKQGKRAAQEQLYRQYCGMLFGICLKYSRNKTEAEDNLHDSFMTIFDKIGHYSAKGSFEGWIKRITVNTVLKTYRKKEYFKVLSDTIVTETEIASNEKNIDIQTLLDYIQQLPNKYRLTFNMYVLDGYSHQEIARQLGTSEGTSKSNLSRARVLLQKKIKADYRISVIGVLFMLVNKARPNGNLSKKNFKNFTKPLGNG